MESSQPLSPSFLSSPYLHLALSLRPSLTNYPETSTKRCTTSLGTSVHPGWCPNAQLPPRCSETSSTFNPPSPSTINGRSNPGLDSCSPLPKIDIFSPRWATRVQANSSITFPAVAIILVPQPLTIPPIYPSRTLIHLSILVYESKHTFIIVLIKLFLFCVMLLGYGLQRTYTSSSASSVKDNAEKKKKSQPFATCSSGISSILFFSHFLIC